MKTMVIAVMLAGLVEPQPQPQTQTQTQPPGRQATPETPQETLMSGRVQFEGSLVKTAPDRVALRVPPTAGATAAAAPAVTPQILVSSAAALADLKVGPSEKFTILADQRRHAGGIVSALKLRDRTGLQFLTEKIMDIPLLSPVDREGWIVTQRPAGQRTFVFEDTCKTIYNVPTVFQLGQQSWELAAQQSEVVTVGGVRYKLQLNQSRFTVTKPCPIPFEGGRTEVEYTITRTTGR